MMSDKPNPVRGERPKPPEGVTQSQGAPRHMSSPQEPREASPREEPCDLLGYMSLGLGMMALLMLPIAMTPAFISLVAFSVVSVVCGAIRLVDSRFRQRSDAAVAGIVSSLVVLGVIALMTFFGTMAEWDIPIFGCTSPSQSDAYPLIDPSIVHEQPYCHDEWDCDDWDIDFTGIDDDELTDDDGTQQKIMRKMDKVSDQIAEDVDKIISNESDGEADSKPSEKADDEEENEKKTKGDEPEEEGSETTGTIKQVPLTDRHTPMKQIPVSSGTEDSIHQA